MGWQAWLAFAAACIALLSWVTIISSAGFVETFDESGFVMRTIFRGCRFIKWGDLQGPAQRFESFIPRLMLRRASRAFFRMHTSYAILLRGKAEENQFAKQIQDRFGIRNAKQVNDLFR